MSRYNTVLYNWTEITNRLMKNKQELAQFLRFSAGMYKQSFSDAALIYYQNPNATKVATLETWNRLGRLVNKGEHSISVFCEGTSARHLFDITQTNGKKIPDLWKITEDIAGDITEVINDKYGKDCKNIQETIATISVDSIKGRLPDVQYATEQTKLSQEQVAEYQKSLVSAVRFVVSNRCEIEGGMKLSGGINLVAADMFKDTRDLIRFGDIVQRSAKDALLEIEREIVQIQKRKREQTYERKDEPDRSDPVRNGVHTQSADHGAAEKIDRSVGQNVAEVGKAGVPAGNADIHNGGQVAADTATDRRRSGDTVSAARPAVPEEKSPSDDLSGNSGVGENAPADNRTSGDAGSRISVENVTPDILKKMRLDADFNRRLDNYEIAGWVFGDSEGMNITPIEYFNRFIADRYSVIQQLEIRDIMEAAIRNEKRLKEQERQTAPVEQTEKEMEPIPDEQAEAAEDTQEEPVSDYDDDEPTESEPVIINNSYVDTGLLPPMTDEFLINAIIKEAGEMLDKAIIKCAATGEQQHLGNYFGFDVTIEKKLVSSSDETGCVVVLNGELKYSTEVTMANALGNIRRLEILADTSINKQIQLYSEQLEQAKANLEEARTAVTKPFEREEELEKKQARLDFVNAALSGGKTEDPEPILIDEPSASEHDTKSAPVPPTSVIMTVKMPTAIAAPAFDKPQLKPVPPPAAHKEPQKMISHKTRR